MSHVREIQSVPLHRVEGDKGKHRRLEHTTQLYQGCFKNAQNANAFILHAAPTHATSVACCCSLLLTLVCGSKPGSPANSLPILLGAVSPSSYRTERVGLLTNRESDTRSTRWEKGHPAVVYLKNWLSTSCSSWQGYCPRSRGLVGSR